MRLQVHCTRMVPNLDGHAGFCASSLPAPKSDGFVVTVGFTVIQ